MPAHYQRLKLPIGIQTFREIREEGYYYVDKTPYVAQLAHSGKYYFLSRPRRFGKSLFLDTLAEAFEGNRALFEGLHLEQHWDWDKRFPVMRISFGAGTLQDRAQLDTAILNQLSDNAARLGVVHNPADGVAYGLEQLIHRAALKYGQRAVVLVDEYDKPILDNLTQPDIARAMREGLRNLYSVLKARDADLKFVFLTGVSKFSKVSIFSGLNNLYDITLSNEFAGICGYTDADIDTVFAAELPGLDRDEIRRWYNGYQWGSSGSDETGTTTNSAGSPSVYNPFDVLLLLRDRQYQAWWFETGTPTFLVDWLKNKQYFTPQLESSFATADLLSAFDVDRIRAEAMLWQTGYLTLKSSLFTPGGMIYTLGLPNQEVRSALNQLLLDAWIPTAIESLQAALPLYAWIAEGNTAAVHAHFQRLFAAIPHTWYRNNPITQYEGYWASVFYSHLAALGLEVVAEDISNQGQCDLTVKYQNAVWVIEFKLVDGDTATGAALAQIQAKNYAVKYRAPGVHVIELGIEFSTGQRQIVGWQVGVST